MIDTLGVNVGGKSYLTPFLFLELLLFDEKLVIRTDSGTCRYDEAANPSLLKLRHY